MRFIGLPLGVFEQPSEKPKCYRTGENPVNPPEVAFSLSGAPGRPPILLESSGRLDSRGSTLRVPEAYARVASPERGRGDQGYGESEFSTGVEKTVENKGFLISQA